MQTALVHTRHPIQFVRAAGFHAAATLLFLVVGTPLAFLASPILWAFLAYDLVDGTGTGDRLRRLADGDDRRRQPRRRERRS